MIAASGFERIEAGWWLDIAQQLIDAAVEWVRSAALMDLRFWQGQVRIGRRQKLPSRRTLMKRWGWSDHKVRALLKAENWHDPHHVAKDKQAETESPKVLPKISQESPSFGPIAGVEPRGVSQQSPNDLPKISTRADYTEHRTQNTDLKQHRPDVVALVAGPEGIAETPTDNRDQPLSAVQGNRMGQIWGDLVRDLERAGFETLGEVLDAGRDEVSDRLGRSSSQKRLDRITACLTSRGLSSPDWAPSGAHSRARAPGRPVDDLSLNRKRGAQSDADWIKQLQNNPYMKFVRPRTSGVPR